MTYAARTFTEDEEPPCGERINLMCTDGYRLAWDGKRWYDPAQGDHISLREAWPPWDYGPGPWFEVPERKQA